MSTKDILHHKTLNTLESDRNISMIRPISLRMNFSWMFFGKAIYSLSQWGILVLLAKFGTPELVGNFGLALAITSPVLIFFNLNLSAIMVTDTKEEHKIQDYVSVRHLSNIMFVVVVYLVCMICGYRASFIVLVLAVALMKVIESSSEILQGINQKHERLDRVAQSLIIKGLLSILFVAIILFFTKSLFLMLCGMLLSCLLVLVAWDLPFAKRLEDVRIITLRIKYSTLIRIVLYALPLGVFGTVISLKTNIPRYFVEGNLNKEMLGYFTALGYFVVAGDAVIMSLSQASMPRLAKYYNNNVNAFFALFLKLCGIAIGLGMCSIIFVMIAGQPFLAILYGPGYAQFTDVFFWIMVSGTGAYITAFATTSMIVMGRLRTLATVAAMSTLACLLCSWLFVRPFGLLGGAVAMVISSWLNAFLGIAVIIKDVAKIRRATSSEKIKLSLKWSSQ